MHIPNEIKSKFKSKRKIIEYIFIANASLVIVWLASSVNTVTTRCYVAEKRKKKKKKLRRNTVREWKTVVCTIKIANQANNMPNLQIIHLGTQHAKEKKTRWKSWAREEKCSAYVCKQWMKNQIKTDIDPRKKKHQQQRRGIEIETKQLYQRFVDVAMNAHVRRICMLLAMLPYQKQSRLVGPHWCKFKHN